ncbi:MAG: hypothetical protein CM1200mP29_11110 [Verrucomicrobiota bacterium]|nr:MAG: hypothetical protein CM1200mP29_11110 [Verrucomicrobiota bacterium]
MYGYDPATGKELWKVKYGSLGFSIVPKPVLGWHGYIGTSYMKPRLIALDITQAIRRLPGSVNAVCRPSRLRF